MKGEDGFRTNPSPLVRKGFVGFGEPAVASSRLQIACDLRFAADIPVGLQISDVRLFGNRVVSTFAATLQVGGVVVAGEKRGVIEQPEVEGYRSLYALYPVLAEGAAGTGDRLLAVPTPDYELADH